MKEIRFKYCLNILTLGVSIINNKHYKQEMVVLIARKNLTNRLINPVHIEVNVKSYKVTLFVNL